MKSSTEFIEIVRAAAGQNQPQAKPQASELLMLWCEACQTHYLHIRNSSARFECLVCGHSAQGRVEQ